MNMTEDTRQPEFDGAAIVRRQLKNLEDRGFKLGILTSGTEIEECGRLAFTERLPGETGNLEFVTASSTIGWGCLVATIVVRCENRGVFSATAKLNVEDAGQMLCTASAMGYAINAIVKFVINPEREIQSSLDSESALVPVEFAFNLK